MFIQPLRGCYGRVLVAMGCTHAYQHLATPGLWPSISKLLGEATHGIFYRFPPRRSSKNKSKERKSSSALFFAREQKVYSSNELPAKNTAPEVFSKISPIIGSDFLVAREQTLEKKATTHNE